MNQMYARIAELSERAYMGHPSCTTCFVDYLGEGTCGACLFVANLVADSVIVLDRAVRAEGRITLLRNEEGDLLREETDLRTKAEARIAKLEHALTTVRLRLSASDDIGLGARVLLLNAIERALGEK